MESTGQIKLEWLPYASIVFMDGQDGRKLNPRRIEQSDLEKLARSIEADPTFLENRPSLVSRSGGKDLVYAGHQRARACGEILGWEKVPCLVEIDVPDSIIEARCIQDNDSAGKWDISLLKAEWAGSQAITFSVPVISFDPEAIGEAGKAKPENYSRKIAAPVYEPRNEKPPISALCDAGKMESLLAEIEASGATDEEKAFLKLAAQRHLVFSYSKIADFYAHSGAEVQRLMENSALVIIDFERAIENGFVRVSEQMADLYRADHED